MPKASTKGSKKRDGGSNGNLNGESAKETMLSEVRVSRPPFIIGSCTTSVGYSECHEVRAEHRPDNRSCIYKAPKRIIVSNSFSLRTGGKARWSSVFSESSTNEDK